MADWIVARGTSWQALQSSIELPLRSLPVALLHMLFYAGLSCVLWWYPASRFCGIRFHSSRRLIAVNAMTIQWSLMYLVARFGAPQSLMTMFIAVNAFTISAELVVPSALSYMRCVYVQHFLSDRAGHVHCCECDHLVSGACRTLVRWALRQRLRSLFEVFMLMLDASLTSLPRFPVPDDHVHCCECVHHVSGACCTQYLRAVRLHAASLPDRGGHVQCCECDHLVSGDWRTMVRWALRQP